MNESGLAVPGCPLRNAKTPFRRYRSTPSFVKVFKNTRELKMDERDASWHIKQVVPSWLAITWETDRQSPRSAWSQSLDELFERVDHSFPFFDNSRNRPYAAAFEQ
jgi:hypothetical protein